MRYRSTTAESERKCEWETEVEEARFAGCDNRFAIILQSLNSLIISLSFEPLASTDSEGVRRTHRLELSVNTIIMRQIQIPSRAGARVWTRRIVATIFWAGCLLFGYLSYQIVSENFRTVIPGEVYRSAQLDAAGLERNIRTFGLKSIVNLRGPNPDARWYIEERSVATRFGVRHYDFPTDSRYPPTVGELSRWLDLLATCEKPVLFHCQSGIDRTGLIAAVCRLQGDSTACVRDAEAQLSLSYGHLPWRANQGRFRQFLRTYRQWLEQAGVEHSCATFRRWATQVYEPIPEWKNAA